MACIVILIGRLATSLHRDSRFCLSKAYLEINHRLYCLKGPAAAREGGSESKSSLNLVLTENM